ncbi:OLC1v1026738C1 [Oldenlandia corymbosa var. corymbosa]|uniref:OLC1v1026738C1 n=1 Tax=Oldenlandia corymbosa var. corymbosa TaxID=529605 RepID=A0AAV1CAR9_OLDCO|nr:OLC1v1026738C1 [Oldenlandia corymbosa var. corymbosa]
MLENNDILSEILLRVDPGCIFNYILVSKRWLELITSPYFQQVYLKRWYIKGCHLKVIGFLVYNLPYVDNSRPYPSPPAVQLLPTSKFGRDINRSKFMGHAGYFIAATSDGFILSGKHPQRYYVCNPITKQRMQLPQPPVLHMDVAIAILSCDKEERVFDTQERMKNFEVMYAESNFFDEPDDNTVSIHTFSSLTGQWYTSTLSCSTPFSLCRGVGTVARGFVYWMARVGCVPYFAAFDTKSINDTGRITLIMKPWSTMDSWFTSHKELPSYLGVSSEGFLQYAAIHYRGELCIWVLSDDNFEGQTDFDAQGTRWRVCYKIDIFSMMMGNSAVLSACHIEIGRRTPFVFVAFVPGKSDSVFLRCEEYFFIYQYLSQKLERIHYDLDNYSFPFARQRDRCHGLYHPFTVSGAWPSSPL